MIKKNILTKQWINEKMMTEKEKEENPSYKVTGGFLKETTIQEAFQKMWGEITDEERSEILSLPNFDAVIFREITGIDVKGEKG